MDWSKTKSKPSKQRSGFNLRRRQKRGKRARGISAISSWLQSARKDWRHVRGRGSGTLMHTAICWVRAGTPSRRPMASPLRNTIRSTLTGYGVDQREMDRPTNKRWAAWTMSLIRPRIGIMSARTIRWARRRRGGVCTRASLPMPWRQTTTGGRTSRRALLPDVRIPSVLTITIINWVGSSAMTRGVESEAQAARQAGSKTG